MIIWIDVEKALNKTQHDKKNSQKQREGTSQTDKKHQWKTQMLKEWCFPLYNQEPCKDVHPPTLLNIY